jgi:hypothetical protein
MGTKFSDSSCFSNECNDKKGQTKQAQEREKKFKIVYYCRKIGRREKQKTERERKRYYNII